MDFGTSGYGSTGKVTSCSAGRYHSVCVTDNYPNYPYERVFSFGTNTVGQKYGKKKFTQLGLFEGDEEDEAVMRRDTPSASGHRPG